MLVLSRKPGERIRIECGGKVIWVTIVKIHGKYKVRLGFESDKDVKFAREELLSPAAQRHPPPTLDSVKIVDPPQTT